ncbi:MAG: glucoamylase family protein [Planctomycetota bacterium]
MRVLGRLAVAYVLLAASGASIRADDTAVPTAGAQVILDCRSTPPVFPSRHGIAFRGGDAVASQPVSIRALLDSPGGEAEGGPGIQIRVGTASRFEYYCESVPGGWDWRGFRDGRLVIRIDAPAGVAATLFVEADVASGGQPMKRARLCRDLPLASTLIRSAMARDGFADVAVPIGALRRIDADAGEPKTPAELPRAYRIGVEFEVGDGDKTDRKIGVQSIRVERTEKPTRILESLEKKVFRYFLDNNHKSTGLVRDRADNFGKTDGNGSRIASISATGYFLSALPEAVRRGWLTRDEAVDHVRRVIAGVEKCDHHHGMFYHFVSWDSGQRWDKSEVSTLDSAILFNGAMVCAVAFPDVAPMVDSLLRRVDWSKFLTEKDGKALLSLGWTPETGLLGAIDVRTSETAMPLLLAIGSGQVERTVWYNTSAQHRNVVGISVLHGELPLFVSYFGLGWAELKDLEDKEGVNLSDNAIRAARANREFCRSIASLQYETFRAEHGGFWGLSAGDAMDESGRQIYIAPGPILGDGDGTVWLMATLGSYPWLKDDLDRDLATWQTTLAWPLIQGLYGIAPFNLENGFIGRQIIGIDLGAFLINYQNHTNGTVWRLWERHWLAVKALERIEFRRAAKQR